MSDFDRMVRKIARDQQIAAAPTIGVIRPTIGTRPGDKVVHFEAKCRLCGKVSDPDTIANTNDWLQDHLRKRHGTEILDHREVEAGTEQW